MVRRFVARVTAAGVRLDHAESSRAHDRVLPPLLVHNDSTCELLTPQPASLSVRGEQSPQKSLSECVKVYGSHDLCQCRVAR